MSISLDEVDKDQALVEIELITRNNGRFTLEATNNGEACFRIEKHPRKNILIFGNRRVKRWEWWDNMVTDVKKFLGVGEKKTTPPPPKAPKENTDNELDACPGMIIMKSDNFI